MSDHIPFDIQSEIIKRLRVKSLIRFCSVSKQWKSFIDDPKFIKNYHVNHPNPQHHLFLRYELDNVQTYTSITDNNTFPQQKFCLTAPESLSLLTHKFILASVTGLLCFYCYDRGLNSKQMVVIWNPTVRKSVAIDIPSHKSGCYTVVGFGVCPDTSVPKIVKITVNRMASIWEVAVFTLSTRVWRTVYMGAPFKLCDPLCRQVFVDGVIYLCAYDDIWLDDGVRFNYIISFNLKNEKFGEVCLPERLVHAPYLQVTKVNESLGLLEYYNDGEMTVCGVWMRKNGANETFSKIYTVKVKVEGNSVFNRVLAFRNNGEVVMKMDDDKHEVCRIEVYEPFTGHVNCVGINGKWRTFSGRSYMETLLLLNESDSIIH